MRSGRAGLRVVAFQVWNSIVFICAEPMRAAMESTSTIASRPGATLSSSCLRSGIFRLSAWRWKKR